MFLSVARLSCSKVTKLARPAWGHNIRPEQGPEIRLRLEAGFALLDPVQDRFPPGPVQHEAAIVLDQVRGQTESNLCQPVVCIQHILGRPRNQLLGIDDGPSAPNQAESWLEVRAPTSA